MRRAVAAFLILALAFSSTDAGAAAFGIRDGSSVAEQAALGFGSSLLFIPLMAAFGLPHYGFEFFPYDDSDGYGDGGRDSAYELRLSQELAEHRQGATHGLLRARGSSRIGWDLALSDYSGRSFDQHQHTYYYNGHLTANYLQDGNSLFDLGFGLAGVTSGISRFGPSAEVSYEFFPIFPLNLFVRGQTALLGGQLHGDASGGVGASAGNFGLDLGYRGFFSPIRNIYGPEASIRLWF